MQTKRTLTHTHVELEVVSLDDTQSHTEKQLCPLLRPSLTFLCFSL